ncbi:MAG: hypothetical protein ACK55I_45180, partial [bacterium]
DVRLEARIPEGRDGRRRVVRRVVVLGVGTDDRVVLDRRDHDLRVDEGLRDHRGVQVGARVLGLVLFALAGDVADADDLQALDEAGEGEAALRILVRPGEEALVDR